MLQPFLLALISLLLGSMLFFAVIVAPSVFRFLPGQQAGVFLRGIFPRFYAWGMALSLVMSLVSYFVSSLLLASSLVLLSLFGISSKILMPAINRSRDRAKQGDQAAQAAFTRLHRISVIINLIQMLLLLTAMVYLL